MTFIDWFSGVGGFRIGMEQAGHKCVGFCEYDKFAVMSYTAMHLASAEQMEYIKGLDFKGRQGEVLKDEYKNGEWYANDIRWVHADDIPKADCWCFGFPCQDISIAGNQRGFAGERSSLFFRIMRLVGDQKEENKPSILLIENVKNLLSVNRGRDFARLLICLDENGYDAEWQVINSKDYEVPQNRERVYIVGHLRGRGGNEIFPFGGTAGKNRILQLGHMATERKNPNAYRVYSVDGLSPCLGTMEGGGRTPHVAIGLNYINDAHKIPFVWSKLYNCYVAVRKLTPKECWRLQGWADEYFDRARFVNSDSQLYKQAGNGVTIPVIRAIAEKL